ncbi:hypothetical protein ABFS82_08G154800 [Erythranthe guttata]
MIIKSVWILVILVIFRFSESIKLPPGNWITMGLDNPKVIEWTKFAISEIGLWEHRNLKLKSVVHAYSQMGTHTYDMAFQVKVKDANFEHTYDIFMVERTFHQTKKLEVKSYTMKN